MTGRWRWWPSVFYAMASGAVDIREGLTAHLVSAPPPQAARELDDVTTVGEPVRVANVELRYDPRTATTPLRFDSLQFPRAELVGIRGVILACGRTLVALGLFAEPQSTQSTRRGLAVLVPHSGALVLANPRVDRPPARQPIGARAQ